jgi:hypothetical protein
MVTMFRLLEYPEGRLSARINGLPRESLKYPRGDLGARATTTTPE